MPNTRKQQRKSRKTSRSNSQQSNRSNSQRSNRSNSQQSNNGLVDLKVGNCFKVSEYQPNWYYVNSIASKDIVNCFIIEKPSDLVALKKNKATRYSDIMPKRGKWILVDCKTGKKLRKKSSPRTNTRRHKRV